MLCNALFGLTSHQYIILYFRCFLAHFPSIYWETIHGLPNGLVYPQGSMALTPVTTLLSLKYPEPKYYFVMALFVSLQNYIHHQVLSPLRQDYMGYNNTYSFGGSGLKKKLHDFVLFESLSYIYFWYKAKTITTSLWNEVQGNSLLCCGPWNLTWLQQRKERRWPGFPRFDHRDLVTLTCIPRMHDFPPLGSFDRCDDRCINRYMWNNWLSL